jgi:hypothetical protein
MKSAVAAAIASSLLFVSNTLAVTTISEPFLGIRHIQRHEVSPRPVFINILEINPNAPGIRFKLTPPDPNPPIVGGVPDETITRTVRQFLAQQDAQAAINASFFRLQNSGQSLWTNNSGIAVSEGNKYSPWDATGERGINIDANNVATMIRAPSNRPTGFETNPTVNLWNAVRGSDQVLTNNAVTAPPRGAAGDFTGLQPRTAMGIKADGTIMMATFDGRQNGFSEGVYLDEVATYLQQYGAVQALNLDGGGSTTMAFDHYNDTLASGAAVNELLINSPVGTGGICTERFNGANLAVFAQLNPNYAPRIDAPAAPPGVAVLDNFETNEGRFTTPPNAGGFGIGANSNADRVINESYAGGAAERISIQAVGTQGTRMRFLSGAGNPASNATLTASGHVGFFLKLITDIPSGGSLNASVLIDDGSGTEQSRPISITADGQWHLYQWDFDDEDQWENFSLGDGAITSATVTLDSLYVTSPQNFSYVMYFDLVAHNPNGTLDAFLVPEPGSLGVLGLAGLLVRRRVGRAALS